MDEGWDPFDDWSETGEWDSSDDWDAVEETAHGGEAAWWDDDADHDVDDGVDDDFHDDDFHDPDDDDGEFDDGFDADRSGRDDGTVPLSAPGRATPEPAVISAWEFGTAAAVAGWLLDRQAEQIAEGVRAAVAAMPPGHAAHSGAGGSGPAPVGRPRWAALTGAPIDWDAAALRVGDTLERSRLAVTVALRLGAGRQLGLDARPVTTAGRAPAPGLDRSALSFTVAVARIVPDLPVWVMFDDRPGGFRADELRAAFADQGPAGRAYCFVDSAEAAVNVVEWGLDRYGLRLADFRWAGGF